MAAFQAHSDGSSTVYLSGELDLATVPALEVAMAIAAPVDGPITLDVSKLTFMDSTGAGAIVKAAKSLPSGCIVLHGRVARSEGSSTSWGSGRRRTSRSFRPPS